MKVGYIHMDVFSSFMLIFYLDVNFMISEEISNTHVIIYS